MSVSEYHLKDGSVRYRFIVDGQPNSDGSRRQIRRSNFVTLEAAEAARERLLGSKSYRGPRGTVQDALEAWLIGCEADLKSSTLGWYRSIIDTYILPYVGSLPAAELDATARNVLYGTLRTTGGRSGKGLSDSTVRGVHKVLNAALGATEGTRKPRKKATPGRRGVWTEKQLQTFLGHTRTEYPHLYLAYCLAAICGLRRGEIMGLRWSDIDLDSGLLHIRSQRTLVNGQGVLETSPKAGSVRSIPLGTQMVGILRATPRHAELLYPQHPSYLTHRLIQICQELDIPRIALHDLRHTSATLSATMGVDIKTLQQRMGHSDSKMLTEIYLHLVTSAATAASETIEQRLLA